MRAKLLSILSLVVLLAVFTGCVRTVDGRRKAGVPFKRDKIESLYDRPATQVFAAARDVLTFTGTLTSEDTVRQTFEAAVDQRLVWMKVESQEGGVTLLTTQCRGKGGGTDIDLASYLDKQVAVRLASGTLGGTLPPRPKP